MAAAPTKNMTYRFLGDTGLLISKLGLGAWMFYDEKYTVDAWYEMMLMAYKYGVNFFDTAEGYGNGQAEMLMGGAIQKGIAEGVWAREDLVITTKIFFGDKGFFKGGPNDEGLSRKHIIEGTKASLKRLQLEYVDVLFCHRPDDYTPIEEVVRAMNFAIHQGWAFYWSTSAWSTADIREACDIANRLGLIRPVAEQTEYNLYTRSRVDYEFMDLYKKYKYGLTIYSPLASGILTGKYSSGTSSDSRLAMPFYNDQLKSLVPSFEERVAMADKLKPIADELNCSLAQLSTAWCITNENVSSVLIGASRPSQLEENLKAYDVVEKITPEIKAKIEHIFKIAPVFGPVDALSAIRKRFL